MLDITPKDPTLRSAAARAALELQPATVERVREGSIPKGDPLAAARAAALLAVKQTPHLIPDCHPIPIEQAAAEFRLGEASIEVEVSVRAIARTGVEMEALTGAAVAALVLYDMLKPVDETMAIVGVRLVEKSGGKHDFRTALPRPLRAAVLVMSDSVAAGRKSDESGRLIARRLAGEGVEVVDYTIIPDDPQTIERALIDYADRDRLDLVLTTGGTGLGPRDAAPEVMARVIEREAPGIVEAARAHGQERTPFAMLSRGRAGLRGATLIVNLPGSRRGVAESLDALLPGLLHAFPMIAGAGHPTAPDRST